MQRLSERQTIDQDSFLAASGYYPIPEGKGRQLSLFPQTFTLYA